MWTFYSCPCECKDSEVMMSFPDPSYMFHMQPLALASDKNIDKNNIIMIIITVLKNKYIEHASTNHLVKTFNFPLSRWTDRGSKV